MTRTRSAGGSNSLVTVLFVGYLLVVAWIVFWPSAEIAESSVAFLEAALRRLGAPAWVSTGVVEFGTNVLLFVPLSFLGTWLRPRWGVLRWSMVGLLASVGIELAQLLLLNDRSAEAIDLLANTLGATCGAVLARWLRPRLR